MLAHDRFTNMTVVIKRAHKSPILGEKVRPSDLHLLNELRVTSVLGPEGISHPIACYRDGAAGIALVFEVRVERRDNMGNASHAPPYVELNWYSTSRYFGVAASDPTSLIQPLAETPG